MVKLELYRVFREVAEAGNISLAAENLYLSQSAVSQSVKQLEQQLGTRLFLRSPRGVTLKAYASPASVASSCRSTPRCTGLSVTTGFRTPASAR